MHAIGNHQIRIALVDDHPLFREGLEIALRREPDFEVVGHAGDLAAARTLGKTTPIDLAIVDVLLPGATGISAVADLIEAQPSCRVLVLSTVEEFVVVAAMLHTGAMGYALKSQPIAEIVQAVRTVRGGVRYLAPQLPVDLVEDELEAKRDAAARQLTPREREIFELLVQGHSNDQIAEELTIARRTVETHRLRVLNKLSSRTIVELIRLAQRRG